MATFAEQDKQSELPPTQVVFGRTEKMLAVQRKLGPIARTQVPVLIQGESGTGKELCARLMHGLSERPASSLVKVSCPAIPHALVETELFGYEKGAFTGAQTAKRGRVEQAHGGTLLLDEVGSLDLAVQSKLLQVLQDGTYMRVGGHDARNVQTHLVSIANRDLREQVAEGSFRLDFLYRINAITVDLPPLRERTEDLPDLVDYFLEQHARTFRVKPTLLSRSAMRRMENYHWPGNIRQLDNLVRSYVLIGSEEALMEELMSEPNSRGAAEDIDLSSPVSLKMITKSATMELERQIILKVLKANNWNRQKTARWLKISYRSLLSKLNDVAPETASRRPQPQGPKEAKQPSTLGTTLNIS